ncbi:MAG TPA: ATP:cob(I)alamin adenosyltransferase, partial [Verrucomicrobiales bacterium]|nr:ATP:cob(I)alamin adenosyltransferase [Verrucomicrobiales bacterium]
TDARVEAIGSLDELNSVLGLARVDVVADLGDSIDRLQGHLVGLMGELAVLPEDAACYGESGHPS